jgi:hypothetical protein
MFFLLFQLNVIHKNHEHIFLGRPRPSQNVIHTVNDSLLIGHKFAICFQKKKSFSKIKNLKMK